MTTQQPSLTASAKQGDLGAVATLINRSLQPKGITARVAYQDGHLRVLLESQSIPDRQVLVPYIRQGILSLQIPGLHTLDVLGRSPGATKPAWSQTVTLTPSSAEPSSKPQPALDSPLGLSRAPAAPQPASTTNNSANSSSDNSTGRSAIDADAIVAHLNQALATEELAFEAVVSGSILKLTAKTNQLPEGDAFARTIQDVLLPLNLSSIDAVHLYKQKTRGSANYKLKEFTLHQEASEPASTAAIPPASTNLPQLHATSHSTQHPSSDAAESKPSSKQSKYVLIALVTLGVVLLIGAIKLFATPPSAEEVCQDAPGAPEYCQLAVHIMGEQTLHDLKSSATPIAPQQEEQGLRVCSDFTDAQIKREKAQQMAQRPLSMNTELVAPGIMLVDTQLGGFSQETQTNGDMQSGVTNFRTACLFRGKGDRVELIKNVVLPNDWPQQAYQGKQEWETIMRSLKAHQILVALGGSTLFTAIGLFAAATLNLGIQIYSMRGVLQTASTLGTLDTLLLLVIGSNLFSGVPLTCLALGLTQIWVKDLRVDWSAGYRTVAFGVFLMIIIRFLLNNLLLDFIISVI